MGSYSKVVVIEVNGVVCTGKQLHPALLEQGSGGVDNRLNFVLECQVNSITATDFRIVMVLSLTHFEERYLIWYHCR